MVDIGKTAFTEVRAEVTYTDSGSGRTHTELIAGSAVLVAAGLRALAEQLHPTRPIYRGSRDAGGPSRGADAGGICGACSHPLWEHGGALPACRRITLGLACACERPDLIAEVTARLPDVG